jgi:hypothetical protein
MSERTASHPFRLDGGRTRVRGNIARRTIGGSDRSHCVPRIMCAGSAQSKGKAKITRARVSCGTNSTRTLDGPCLGLILAQQFARRLIYEVQARARGANNHFVLGVILLALAVDPLDLQRFDWAPKENQWHTSPCSKPGERPIAQPLVVFD